MAAALQLGVSAGQSPLDYVIGPKDTLTITVWGQPELSGRFTVEPDGGFTFPLIGRVKAAGLALRALEAQLKRGLFDGYLKNPQVTAAIEEYRSQQIFVVGEVRQPAAYPLTGDMTLIEALARAGSTTANAGTEALIVRSRSGRPASSPVLPDGRQTVSVVRVDLEELQTGGPAQNLNLRNGDTVFVPRAQTLYVAGQVRNPGAYPYQKSMTVLQALSLAGGATDRGSTARIRILRTVDGRKKELKVKLTDLVRPVDTIVVPERFF